MEIRHRLHVLPTRLVGSDCARDCNVHVVRKGRRRVRCCVCWCIFSASCLSTALRRSSLTPLASRPGRIFLASSSSIGGTVQTCASFTVTSKTAFFSARVSSLKPYHYRIPSIDKVTKTVLVSPTLAPTNHSTNPSMYRPGPKTTSTLSPLAAFGRGSPLDTPSSTAI